MTTYLNTFIFNASITFTLPHPVAQNCIFRKIHSPAKEILFNDVFETIDEH